MFLYKYKRKTSRRLVNMVGFLSMTTAQGTAPTETSGSVAAAPSSSSTATASLFGDGGSCGGTGGVETSGMTASLFGGGSGFGGIETSGMTASIFTGGCDGGGGGGGGGGSLA